MARAYLGLGANVGDREANLLLALQRLSPQCTVTAASSLYRSSAVVLEGQPPGPDYLNAACAVETQLDAPALLAHVKHIEHAIGRRPATRWAPRPIDIDILLYDDAVIETAKLCVPHRLLAERDFVLAPLAEIAPDAMHPVLRRRIGELARGIDLSQVELVSGPEWAADAIVMGTIITEYKEGTK